ncbi:MAG: UDP-N-acetylmuramoyl-L-alanyl-D-glutamate--2,6-diaminopimelate ligase [Solirubrobacterales bacterium]
MDLGALTGDPALAGTEISDLVHSSSDAAPGSLFICVKGFSSDGHDFAPDAIARGAVALVCERPLDLGVPELVVEDARAMMPKLAKRFFGDPSRELELIGITGTNGKTTIAHLLRQLMLEAGRPCGMIGTVSWVIGGEEFPAVRTTPESIELVRALRAVADSGEELCAIEVSSHALELGRVDELAFAAAIFTNLTQDHLDFHESMEDYFAAKRLLFSSHPGVSIVNSDDAYGRRLIEEFECTSYSTIGSEADFVASDIEFDATGSRFNVQFADGSIELATPLPGEYNVSNVLATFAAAVALGVEPAMAAHALASAPGAPGRLESVPNDLGIGVYVDYAHTPDSVENVLRAARGLPHERLAIVVGCGGDRDRNKRPLMGAAAADGADVVYVTSDNPRSEDPAAIIEEVLVGAREAAAASGAEVVVEVDRRAAIERALAAAGPGDLVVIAGKGHEQGQEFADGRQIPFDDVTVARESLAVLDVTQ